MDDDGFLWYALKGEDYKIAIPRVMIPGALLFVQSMFGHRGVARTTFLVQGQIELAGVG